MIEHNYLSQQFEDADEILAKIKSVVTRGDFTLGKEVAEFEERFADYVGAKYAIGVNSGTDAIFLSLKVLGIGEKSRVIAPAYTFYATIGAIMATGATVRLVDIGDDLCIEQPFAGSRGQANFDALVPVSWAGHPVNLDGFRARFPGPYIVEDACQAVGARERLEADIACYSLHPLKNLNVWGDGGVIATNVPWVNDRLRLLRNHGLRDRDTCETFGYNSRLDTIQAVVGLHMLDKLPEITRRRQENAARYDSLLEGIDGVVTPPKGGVYHLYIIRAKRRDELQNRLKAAGIDAKVHYPTPLHLQPAAMYLGYKRGDFPVAELVCSEALSLPVHEFLTESDIERVTTVIREFYK